MTASSDVRYGRRGGRIVTAAGWEDYGPCELCGGRLTVGPAGGQHGAHVVCRDAEAARKRVAT